MASSLATPPSSSGRCRLPRDPRWPLRCCRSRAGGGAGGAGDAAVAARRCLAGGETEADVAARLCLACGERADGDDGEGEARDGADATLAGCGARGNTRLGWRTRARGEADRSEPDETADREDADAEGEGDRTALEREGDLSALLAEEREGDLLPLRRDGDFPLARAAARARDLRSISPLV